MQWNEQYHVSSSEAKHIFTNSVKMRHAVKHVVHSRSKHSHEAYFFVHKTIKSLINIKFTAEQGAKMFYSVDNICHWHTRERRVLIDCVGEIRALLVALKVSLFLYLHHHWFINQASARTSVFLCWRILELNNGQINDHLIVLNWTHSPSHYNHNRITLFPD